jgi:Fe-S-cluster containining protein
LDIHEEVFYKVNCLECANCCKTTGPLFTEKDIERISRHLRMKSSSFVEQYLYKDEDNDWILKQLPCPFLDAENYCMIYEVRPKACREYPHTDRKNFYQINDLTLKNILICPAVYQVVEKMIKKIPL